MLLEDKFSCELTSRYELSPHGNPPIVFTSRPSII